MVSIAARLERSEREVALAAVDWLEATMGHAPKDVVEHRRVGALGEYWRRKKLVELYHEVQSRDVDLVDRSVYFLALDSCSPETIPSFREWMDERAHSMASANMPGSGSDDGNCTES